MSKLLKEAIADAKAVRETALANARLALEEAFAPRLQSMLTKKLREEELELDDESEDEVSDEVEEGSYFEDDEEVDVADEAPEEESAEEEAPAEEAPAEDEVGGEEEIADEIEDLEGDEEEAVEEDSFDLDTIIRELEQEIEEGSYSEEDEEVELEEASCSEDDEEEAIEESEDSEEEEEAVEEQSKSSELGKGGDEHVVVADSDDEELPAETKTVAGDPGTEGEEEKVAEIDEEIDIEIVEESEESEEESEEEAVEESIEESEEEEDEEINLEEILKELEEETNIEDEEESSEEISELKSANEKLQKENDEYRKVYKFLRGKLNEVNLLNAKLLYTNKLFKKHALSEDQKLKVVESFDLTKNVREAKLVYATLGESFRTQATEVVEEAKSAPKKKKTEKNPLTEGIASKAIQSTKPSKKILSEGNELADRFKKLAGIKS
jgi:hypothetical protein